MDQQTQDILSFVSTMVKEFLKNVSISSIAAAFASFDLNTIRDAIAAIIEKMMG